MRGALSALLAAGIMLVVSSVAALAQTTGNEQIDGHLSVSFVSGTREVITAVRDVVAPTVRPIARYAEPTHRS